MNIESKIKAIELENARIEQVKGELINRNLIQINKVIEEKIINLKQELRDSAINEVCGEEYNALNIEIEKNNKYISILSEINDNEGIIGILADVIPVKELPVENINTNSAVETTDEINKESSEN